MLDAARLSAGIAEFLAGRTYVALTARSGDGRLWASPLVGEPGFVRVLGPASLVIHATPGRADPLHGLAAPQPVGLIAIDYPRRRRFRLNGTLVPGGCDDELLIEVTEAFGNCPRFLTRRTIDPAPTAGGTADLANGELEARADVLSAADVVTVGGADTFILGTTHPDRGNDASHRGGPPGFVRTEGRTLWWPDYPGNNLFTSIGNLAVDNVAALLFLDFSRRIALHLSGTAELSDVPVGARGDDGRTGRRVVFTTERVVRSPLSATSRMLGSAPPPGRAE
jgi:hypothetical protein